MSESGKGIAAARRPNRGPSAGPENRRALVAAAREIFAADGLQAPLSSIAKRAGVGQGSLYRHFPDRLALAVAVFDENLDELAADIAPDEATLDVLLDVIVEQAVASTALVELIWANQYDERVAHLQVRLREITEVVLARERAAKRIGEHIDTDDVLLAIGMMAGVLARTSAAERSAVGERAEALLRAAFEPRSS